ncbi:MAG: HAMP domain-containing histidine kinase [Alphaproteobacteria bacterium]|nr:HAMP domain-containing histidine kinase [Alphaproteobacteria bacterium]MCB9793213.1 HAMP domain-containing histidine kinase [Alphaproteobacteria bacterium]
MSPWFVPSLLPILLGAALLAAQSWRWGRRGLAAYCLGLVGWAASLLLTARPATVVLGERLLMLGFFVPAGFLHAALEDMAVERGRAIEDRERRVLTAYYLGAVVLTALGLLPMGLFLRAGGTAPGPLWLPMFLLAGSLSAYPLGLLWRELGQAEGARLQRLRYLLLAGALNMVGGGVNILLTMTNNAYPAGLYMVLSSLGLLAWVVNASRLPDFERFVDASLRYSLVAALLSTAFLVMAMAMIHSAAPGGSAYSWGALFLLFLVLLVGQPLMFWARGQLAASFFAGKGDVAGMARALAESEARAEHAERLAEIGALASAVAHEVRNPLGVITACVALLERQGADAGTLAEVRAQVERAAHFADDLLDYGRPSPLSLRPVDLAGAAEMACGELRQALPLEPMPRFEVEGEASPVQGDLGQLIRVIGILVENAALAGAKRVRVRVSPEGEGARVEVEDDGPGVPEALADRVLEPFVTGRSRDAARPGTGLGLAIARGVAERHHGSLEYLGHSKDMGGAHFSLSLPGAPPLPMG